MRVLRRASRLMRRVDRMPDEKFIVLIWSAALGVAVIAAVSFTISKLFAMGVL